MIAAYEECKALDVLGKYLNSRGALRAHQPVELSWIDLRLHLEICRFIKSNSGNLLLIM